MSKHEGIWSEYRPTYWDGWDAVKRMGDLVRCKDCMHYVEDPEPIDPGWPMMCADSGRDMLEPDGFCHRGERRADA